MRERGDFQCHHEPYMYLYYVGDGKKEMPFFDVDPEHPTTYEGIRAMLLEAGERGPVFFKDMSYYILERMMADPSFARRLTNTFLIRDPERSIISFYKLDPDLTLEEIGLEAECRHHRWLWELLGESPVVIDAGDIQADAEGTLRAYAQAIGVEFLPDSLVWDGEAPQEWGHVSAWHGSVMGASGIGDNPAGSGNASSGAPLVTLDSHPKLRRYYDHHRPYYTELLAHRLKSA